MDYVTVPKGTFLYRAAPQIPRQKADFWKLAIVDVDTGKLGLYFASNMLQSAAIQNEYYACKGDTAPSTTIGVYRTTADINVAEDKYAYRDIHPERYYELKRDKSGNVQRVLRPDVPVLADENISHIAQTDALIDDSREPECLSNLPIDGYELFLTPEHFKKLQYIIEFDVTPVLENVRKQRRRTPVEVRNPYYKK